MRSLFPVLFLCAPLLASCHKTDTPQIREMAQCAGAMGLEHEFLVHQSPPRYDLLPPLAAAITFYKYRLRIGGVPDQGRAEAMAFADQHLHDHEMIGKMAAACGHKLWANTEFRANYDDLIRDGIEHDPACKPDPSRCTKSGSQPSHPRHP
jgi:hypothetical protein